VAPRLVRQPAHVRDLVLCGRGDAVSDAALVSLVLGHAEETVGRGVLDRHPLPEGLWSLSADDLICHEGIGPAAAARLLASLELSRRAAMRGDGSRPVISGPDDVARVCGPQMRGLDREHFWALALNTKNQLLRMVEISVGSLNASIVHPRELFKEAVRLSAASVVVVHNHPSGDPTPSAEDQAVTRQLVAAGRLLDVPVYDHVVIAGDRFVSFATAGLL